MFQDSSPSIIQEVKDYLFDEHDVQLFIKREDLLNDDVSGNKWRKLKYNIEEASKHHGKQILTFGGAFSNHIVACAAAAKCEGLQSVGIIRGEEADFSNPTLSKALSYGMLLEKISRADYKNKMSANFLRDLEVKYGSFFLIPEGGSNLLAVKGVAEMMMEIPDDFQYIVAPVGTGGTLAGIILGSEMNQKIIGLPVLKGVQYLEDEINMLLQDTKRNNWKLIHDYHFKGYAKFNTRLIQFINDFKRNKSVALDPIYTGKMMYGIYDLIAKGYFKRGTKILAIHTGGLQGIDGFRERFDENILL